ncbi:peptidase S10, serine carboxypeptidase, partial [Blyttiomyces helicus]
QYAGNIPIKEDGASLFFWYFDAAPFAPHADKLVVWLNGGPGCSSLYGSFVENGPVAVHDNGSLSSNAFSWHKLANVLYIEQPINTGFSFGPAVDNVQNELQV